jgi:hypothetical protein
MADSFEEAEEFERRGDLRRALGVYAALSAAGEGGCEALMRQAMIRRQFGEVSGVTSLFAEAARADPGNPYPHMRLGQMAEGLRRHGVSARHHAAAVAVAPFSDEMKVNLSAAYIRLGWLDLAYHVARQVAPDVGDWWAGARRQGIETYRERRREAIEALRIRPRPLDRAAGWEIARHLHHLGRLKLALKIADALIADDPHWFWPVWLKADTLARQDGPDAAIAYLHGSSWHGRGSPEYLEAEARLMLEAGRYEAFLQRLEEEPTTERRGRVRDTVVAALCTLERDEELRQYCVDWMAEDPKLATPASYIALIQVRRAAHAPAAGQAAYPRPLRAHLMQFWNAPDVPADVRGTMGSWLRHHPGWSHTVFDAAGAERFLRERLGEDALRAFQLCHHPAMMADMFRIAFLSVAGGFYADADEKCLRPLTDILPDPHAVEIVAPHSGNIPGHVDNNFIGCRPGSEVARIVTEGIVEDVLRCAQEGRRADIWQMTGPGAVMRGVAKHLGALAPGVVPAVVLLPMQQYQALVRTEEDLAYKRNPAANWRLAELA